MGTNRHFLAGTIITTCLLAAATAPAQPGPAASSPCTPWPATDALGRKVPGCDEVGPPRPDRFVGIFYFIWHDHRHGQSPHWEGPHDVAKILARDPDAIKKPDSPLWGPIGMYLY